MTTARATSDSYTCSFRHISHICDICLKWQNCVVVRPLLIPLVHSLYTAPPQFPSFSDITLHHSPPNLSSAHGGGEGDFPGRREGQGREGRQRQAVGGTLGLTSIHRMTAFLLCHVQLPSCCHTVAVPSPPIPLLNSSSPLLLSLSPHIRLQYTFFYDTHGMVLHRARNGTREHPSPPLPSLYLPSLAAYLACLLLPYIFSAATHHYRCR